MGSAGSVELTVNTSSRALQEERVHSPSHTEDEDITINTLQIKDFALPGASESALQSVLGPDAAAGLVPLAPSTPTTPRPSSHRAAPGSPRGAPPPPPPQSQSSQQQQHEQHEQQLPQQQPQPLPLLGAPTTPRATHARSLSGGLREPSPNASTSGGLGLGPTALVIPPLPPPVPPPPEINTLFMAVDGVREAWENHLQVSLRCLEDSDKTMIKALSDMVATCVQTLAEIRGIRAGVKRESQRVRNGFVKARERVAEAKQALEETQQREFKKNLFTFERASDRKERKIHSAQRRYEGAMSDLQDARDRYADYQLFYKKEAARVVRVYDRLKHHQHLFLVSLYSRLVFWRRRLADKLAELADRSRQHIALVDVHTDVHSFIEANRSGLLAPHESQSTGL